MHRKQKYRPKDSTIDVEKQGFFLDELCFRVEDYSRYTMCMQMVGVK